MEKVHYFFDESGEKGFVTGEFEATAFGLVAGIALPSRNIVSFERELDGVFSSLDLSVVDKIHATELFQHAGNVQVRQDLMDFLNGKDEWLIIYEALYPQGVLRHQQKSEEIFSSHIPEAPKVKVSGNPKRVRLYTLLLEGVITKLDEMCRLENSTEVFSHRKMSMSA